MMKILIDADTGIDDSIAILFALKRQDVQVVGITTGFGNTDARQAADNSLRLIQLAAPGYEVPVAVGAAAPLEGEWEGPVPHIHGRNGIGDAQIPPSSQKPLEESACDFIIRMAHAHAGELTLVMLARMTNLALALKKEPELPKLIRRVVFMGGTWHTPGNVSPVAEANIAGDPEAADLVFQAGFNLTMVGLDVTQKVRLTAGHLRLLEKYAAPENRPIVDYLKSGHAPLLPVQPDAEQLPGPLSGPRSPGHAGSSRSRPGAHPANARPGGVRRQLLPRYGGDRLAGAPLRRPIPLRVRGCGRPESP